MHGSRWPFVAPRGKRESQPYTRGSGTRCHPCLSLCRISRAKGSHEPGVTEPAPAVWTRTQRAIASSPPIVAIARKVALVAGAVPAAGYFPRTSGRGSHLETAVPACSRLVVPFSRAIQQCTVEVEWRKHTYMLTYSTLCLCQEMSTILCHVSPQVPSYRVGRFPAAHEHFITGGLSVCKLSLLTKKKPIIVSCNLLMIRQQAHNEPHRSSYLSPHPLLLAKISSLEVKHSHIPSCVSHIPRLEHSAFSFVPLTEVYLYQNANYQGCLQAYEK